MIQFAKRLFCTIGIVLVCSGLQAQSLDQAKKLYNEGQYAEAKPAFERLVKQAPNNSSYNHWYGVCCFETGDMVNAEKHLEFAMKKKIQEAYRYLGELYFQTYRFEEASGMFAEYIDLLSKKKQNVETFELRKGQADKAARLLDKVEKVQVIDSAVVNKDDFLSTYMLSEENGTITSFRDFFQSSEPIESTVYKNQKGDKIYYAQPTEENHYCIFSQSKLLDQWSDMKQLPMNVNSNNDDNYPFVMPDGVTIYYASKGNGTLGGYDLFVTRYNMNTETYLTPEQLGMPFNSPFNDYMMVIDESKHLGWFVSDRFQPEGKVCIYLFIPNESRSRVDSDDPAVKRARAMLLPIQSTWEAGADYSAQVKLAHEQVPFGEVKAKKDFEFPINNNLVYYTLDEIKSPEARSHYEKALQLRKQIADLSAKLDTMRMDYTKGNKAKRDQLSSSILQAEGQLDSLLGQPAEWEKKARNAEINYLKNNR